MSSLQCKAKFTALADKFYVTAPLSPSDRPNPHPGEGPFIILHQLCHFSPLSKNTMVEVGRSERLLKNCRNKGSKLGWAKNTAQRVNSIKNFRGGRWQSFADFQVEEQCGRHFQGVWLHTVAAGQTVKQDVHISPHEETWRLSPEGTGGKSEEIITLIITSQDLTDPYKQICVQGLVEKKKAKEWDRVWERAYQENATWEGSVTSHFIDSDKKGWT